MGRWMRYAPYQSVAERKEEAEALVAKMIRNGKNIQPIAIFGKKIATTFWGKGWCDHLETFSDYENRLPRGRSCVRNSAVLDLQIIDGKIKALVQGSETYKVTITVKPVQKGKWKAILKQCTGEIGSVIELLQGKFSSEVMKTMTDTENGLFPLQEEITLKCSCPDWAMMCKHVAAVLYGIGARLDHEPQLLFTLRNVDPTELLSTAKVKTKKPSANALQGQDLSELFGIDMDDVINTKKKPVEKRKPTTKKRKTSKPK